MRRPGMDGAPFLLQFRRAIGWRVHYHGKWADDSPSWSWARHNLGEYAMNTSQEVIETFLDDLQSEMEAEGRQVDRMRASLFEKQFKQAAVMGELARRLEDLRASVTQQRETLRALRVQMRARRRHDLK